MEQLVEFFYRLNKEGYQIILSKPEGEHPEINDITDNVDAVVESIEQVNQQITALGENRHVIFTADRSSLLNGGIYELQKQLQHSKVQSIITFLLDLKGESVGKELPFGPLETVWKFDPYLSARHQYPAVNPIHSTSALLINANLGQNHISIQQRARKLLIRYRELCSTVNERGLNSIPASDIETFNRGERLEAYLTQPFYVAEPFTGKKGESVNLQNTLTDVQKILNGETDKEDIEALTYIGSL
ncbi:F0F1-type ATP synthase beta subunit [Peribacillus deserti]|uniref:F0F1-type ATP synthase beta subunit n=1 Tax=Peribacillus deserti TaxID=673318 RepID=A0ABS2QKQ0_9BACI|nr:hypothetical protein [Peribacillus deserti]MBM7693752.1 F0F1-type ATP synthase beta subunit [Peribacillus deserti]